MIVIWLAGVWGASMRDGRTIIYFINYPIDIMSKKVFICGQLSNCIL